MDNSFSTSNKPDGLQTTKPFFRIRPYSVPNLAFLHKLDNGFKNHSVESADDVEQDRGLSKTAAILI